MDNIWIYGEETKTKSNPEFEQQLISFLNENNFVIIPIKTLSKIALGVLQSDNAGWVKFLQQYGLMKE